MAAEVSIEHVLAKTLLVLNVLEAPNQHATATHKDVQVSCESINEGRTGTREVGDDEREGLGEEGEERGRGGRREKRGGRGRWKNKKKGVRAKVENFAR